ncbi:hypothetical protein ABG768_016943 [Culter alburnus]|uniref:AIG1-type G domain-containing protein n=1 Tax=Culter alburnus TaxID=194366 RepID=A0AAW1YY83_CULAL
MASLGPELHKFAAIIDQSSVIEEGTPTRYRLKPKTDFHDESEPFRKTTFGERDKNKPHKIILMVGETGTGKTKLINAMINYMLDVKREDKVWFEFTDDQSDRTSAHSQTSRITVYGVYLQESKTDLTVIDTPGYGDTRGIENDKEIAKSLLSLSKCNDWVHKIDAVCLVVKASQNRLSDRQIYIFDAVQSLFGKDIVENIALLVTYSHGAHPKNVLTAVEEAKFQCAKNDKNQPVYFLFDNCQGETFHEEYQIVQEQSWNLSFKGMTGFFKLLDNIKPKTLKMTQDVLRQREKLEANITNIQSQIRKMESKQNELKQHQEILEYVKNDKNFECEVEVEYKEKVDIDLSLAKEATCCTVCEENCHYPGCWWVSNLSQCSVMKKSHCTVCTNKCHHSKHVKEAKIYETKTKTEKRTNNDLKKQYEDKIVGVMSLINKLDVELNELKIKKIKLVIETFDSVQALEMITLNTDSLIILQHVDFLIERLKEINEPEKAETLEKIKERAGEEKKQALEYMKMFYK